MSNDRNVNYKKYSDNCIQKAKAAIKKHNYDEAEQILSEVTVPNIEVMRLLFEVRYIKANLKSESETKRKIKRSTHIKPEHKEKFHAKPEKVCVDTKNDSYDNNGRETNRYSTGIIKNGSSNNAQNTSSMPMKSGKDVTLNNEYPTENLKTNVKENNGLSKNTDFIANNFKIKHNVDEMNSNASSLHDNTGSPNKMETDDVEAKVSVECVEKNHISVVKDVKSTDMVKTGIYSEILQNNFNLRTALLPLECKVRTKIGQCISSGSPIIQNEIRNLIYELRNKNDEGIKKEAFMLLMQAEELYAENPIQKFSNVSSSDNVRQEFLKENNNVMLKCFNIARKALNNGYYLEKAKFFFKAAQHFYLSEYEKKVFSEVQTASKVIQPMQDFSLSYKEDKSHQLSGDNDGRTSQSSYVAKTSVIVDHHDLTKCINVAQKAQKEGNLEKAEKFLKKSQRMVPSRHVEDMLYEVQTAIKVKQATQETGQVELDNEISSDYLSTQKNISNLPYKDEPEYHKANMNEASNVDAPTVPIKSNIYIFPSYKEDKPRQYSSSNAYSAITPAAVNHDNVSKCINIAEKALMHGNLEKAEKFLHKAQRMEPSEQLEKILNEVQTASKVKPPIKEAEKSKIDNNISADFLAAQKNISNPPYEDGAEYYKLNINVASQEVASTVSLKNIINVSPSYKEDKSHQLSNHNDVCTPQSGYLAKTSVIVDHHDVSKCINVAQKALSNGNLEKTEKFLQKALRMIPSEQTEKMLNKVQTARNAKQPMQDAEKSERDSKISSDLLTLQKEVDFAYKEETKYPEVSNNKTPNVIMQIDYAEGKSHQFGNNNIVSTLDSDYSIENLGTSDRHSTSKSVNAAQNPFIDGNFMHNQRMLHKVKTTVTTKQPEQETGRTETDNRISSNIQTSRNEMRNSAYKEETKYPRRNIDLNNELLQADSPHNMNNINEAYNKLVQSDDLHNNEAYNALMRAHQVKSITNNSTSYGEDKLYEPFRTSQTIYSPENFVKEDHYDAVQCIDIAQKAITENNLEKAKNFLERAQRMCPSERAQKMLYIVQIAIKANQPFKNAANGCISSITNIEDTSLYEGNKIINEFDRHTVKYTTPAFHNDNSETNHINLKKKADHISNFDRDGKIMQESKPPNALKINTGHAGNNRTDFGKNDNSFRPIVQIQQPTRNIVHNQNVQTLIVKETKRSTDPNEFLIEKEANELLNKNQNKDKKTRFFSMFRSSFSKSKASTSMKQKSENKNETRQNISQSDKKSNKNLSYDKSDRPPKRVLHFSNDKSNNKSQLTALETSANKKENERLRQHKSQTTEHV